MPSKSSRVRPTTGAQRQRLRPAPRRLRRASRARRRCRSSMRTGSLPVVADRLQAQAPLSPGARRTLSATLPTLPAAPPARMAMPPLAASLAAATAETASAKQTKRSPAMTPTPFHRVPPSLSAKRASIAGRQHLVGIEHVPVADGELGRRSAATSPCDRPAPPASCRTATRRGRRRGARGAASSYAASRPAMCRGAPCQARQRSR